MNEPERFEVTGVTPKGKALLDQIAAYERDGMTREQAVLAYNEARRREGREVCAVDGCGFHSGGTLGGSPPPACGGHPDACPSRPVEGLLSWYASWDPEDRPPYPPPTIQD